MTRGLYPWLPLVGSVYPNRQGLKTETLTETTRNKLFAGLEGVLTSVLRDANRSREEFVNELYSGALEIRQTGRILETCVSGSCPIKVRTNQSPPNYKKTVLGDP